MNAAEAAGKSLREGIIWDGKTGSEKERNLRFFGTLLLRFFTASSANKMLALSK